MLKSIMYGVLLVASLITSVISIFRKRRIETVNESGTENIEGTIKITLYDILGNIPKYITAAEKLYKGLVGECGKKTGSQKLEYVLDKLKLDCVTNGIAFDENVFTTKINELIELTKNVN